ncbi:ABC transporter permease [Lederbergia galactosidilytica]|uniref:Peptide ABC transporter permease n=1 Tax=Lederbergia galactosidilytica TaxID=217031 RepID=A0A177ZUY4_9BACI|nr:FtsX-like permease family protein [Lederbergia galactosidilytica]KRG13675.1 peptide ABC transporter permease [Virgibacillus soli]MBP1916322.1 putative ABC transport system permease protein [Lederbergia galactosidilytica]OAK70668.1 peptide ABC transporter permease [Lederbergia galactosidilytica]
MLNIWRISWRNITQNKKRFFFTLLAIILGVSFVTSMLIADKTTNNVFNYYEQMYVANADYWVLSDEHTYSEEMISSIQRDPAVTNTLLALDKQAFFELEDNHSLSERSVRITGVSDQNSPLLKLPVIAGSLDNEGVIIPEVVADLLGKRVGDTVRFTNLGEAKISAIVEYTQLLASPSNWEKAQSTSFRIMAPLDMLREWTGKDEELSYMRFQTKGDGEELFHSFQQSSHGSSVYIEPVVADDLQSNDIGGLYTFFYLIAGLSIFISGFIVFNMIYTSVIERKKEFAIMKSFGYTQGSVSKLVLVEMLLLALIGTAIGVPLGIWLGDLFMRALLSVFEFDMVYTLNWKLPTILAIMIGLLFPLIFSLIPIYNAGKTSILLTLKKENNSAASSRPYLLRGIVGVGLLSFVWIDHAFTYVAVLAGIILLFPLLLIGLNKIIKPILNLVFNYPGILASQNLSQQINRNANTATILTVGISIILLLAAVIESAPTGFEKEIKGTYGGDMRITSEVPWSAEDVTKLRSYDAVTHVEPLTEATPITWETINGVRRQFSVLSVSESGPSLFADQKKEGWSEKLKVTPSVVLGERAFEEWDGNIGQSILMNTPNGEQYYEVIGVVKTSHYSGYVAFMDETYLNDKFGWTNSFDILLHVKDGMNASLRNQLWTDYGDHLSKVQTVEEEIKSTASAITGMNELILILLCMMIGLASIGTANTLLMNTYERRFEIGTMRALGFTKQQVRNMILAEGMLIGISGVIGGIATGVILIYVTSKSQLMEGFISFQLPISNIILAMVAGVSLSLCAAWISSKTASKMDIQSSLKEG